MSFLSYTYIKRGHRIRFGGESAAAAAAASRRKKNYGADFFFRSSSLHPDNNKNDGREKNWKRLRKNRANINDISGMTGELDVLAIEAATAAAATMMDKAIGVAAARAEAHRIHSGANLRVRCEESFRTLRHMLCMLSQNGRSRNLYRNKNKKRGDGVVNIVCSTEKAYLS